LRLNIALYYPWLYLKSGGERVISELISRSRHHWTIITNRFEKDATFPSLRDSSIIELRRVPVKRSFGCVGQAAWSILRQKLPLTGHDALLVVCEGLGDLVTFRNHNLPVVCLCLTPLRAAFDPYYQAEYLARHRNQWVRRLVLQAGAAGFRAVDRRAWKHYVRVLAISHEVKSRILEGKLCSRDKISLAYPGVDCSRLIPTGLYEKTFLLPGRIMWTKNVELGIDAFLMFCSRRPDLADFTLTIAGFVDQKSKPYLCSLRRRAAGCARVRFVESPSDEKLFELYRSAHAILYTPFNEDHGIVPIEAMALEKPVIAVNRGGPRETILDGETGFLVDPQPEAFAVAMETLADDPVLVRKMGAAGRMRALCFDWERFSRAVDDDLDQAIAGEPLAEAGNRAASDFELL
jgi:glycosyltransferase involved in cell wall biosynthesis